MATKISTELLIMILNNVQSTQDLYSSLLVNRNWCKVTIPILWELPFGQECHKDDKKLGKKALCIRTYISCMDTQARTLLTQNGFDLSASPPQTTFDYPSFTHKFIINNLVYFISMYSQQIIGSDQDINNKELSKLFCEIFKLIINRCSFLDYFKLASVPGRFSGNFDNLSNSISSILKLPGAPKVFKNLESFTFEYYRRFDYQFCDSLKLICNNILNMDLKSNTYYRIELLAKLIKVQKRLENLSIFADDFLDIDHNPIFRAIFSQKGTLKSLRLIELNYYCRVEKPPPIGQFTSLQELYIEDCYGLHNSYCLSLASAFTQLSSFHYFHSNDLHIPQEFIIKILETANTNLKNICLDLYPSITFDTFSAILNYCTKVTKLTLKNLSPEQVIKIFNNDFNELRRFSFDCGRERFDADELLCKIAENVPESLETIEFIMEIFSADSLRKFFEGWCRKGRGGNKKIIAKRTELARLCTLSDEHFKVIEEYGVEFELI